ncbi:hypothetical protein SAMD00023378_4538 [Ralstonia sp. NT80]|nr:hypothetical protein SAMD00023378_4538 [Ralstonia sp. NT80]
MAKNPARKWANHAEWCYERQGIPLNALKRKLKSTLRTIRAWDDGTRPVPHWAPQVLRLQRMESAAYLRQLGRPDPRNERPAQWAGADAVNEAGGDHAARG